MSTEATTVEPCLTSIDGATTLVDAVTVVAETAAKVDAPETERVPLDETLPTEKAPERVADVAEIAAVVKPPDNVAAPDTANVEPMETAPERVDAEATVNDAEPKLPPTEISPDDETVVADTDAKVDGPETSKAIVAKPVESI